MTDEKITDVKLEKINHDNKFDLDGKVIKFYLSDFAKNGTGFNVKQNESINGVNIHECGIVHELYLPKSNVYHLETMQIQQSVETPELFSMLLGFCSGCCDGGAIGGIYNARQNDFDIKFAVPLPFNVKAIVGHIPDSGRRGLALVSGAGCHGCGVQSIYSQDVVETNYLYDNSKLDNDPKIFGKYEPSYQSFLYDTIQIKDGQICTTVNLEEAYKVENQFYQHKELLKTNPQKAKEKYSESHIDIIEKTIAEFRLAASQSRFIDRDKYEVYP